MLPPRHVLLRMTLSLLKSRQTPVYGGRKNSGSKIAKARKIMMMRRRQGRRKRLCCATARVPAITLLQWQQTASPLFLFLVLVVVLLLYDRKQYVVIAPLIAHSTAPTTANTTLLELFELLSDQSLRIKAYSPSTCFARQAKEIQTPSITRASDPPHHLPPFSFGWYTG